MLNYDLDDTKLDVFFNTYQHIFYRRLNLEEKDDMKEIFNDFNTHNK